MISNFTRLFLFILFLYCAPSVMAQPKAKGKASYRFYNDSKIEVIYDDKKQPYEYKIVKGNSIVFEYIYIMADDSMIADDEYRESVVFEVPRGRKSFLLKDAELRKANCFFYWACFCPTSGNHLVEKGEISGKRYGRKNWLINMDISYVTTEFPDWPKTVTFEQRYFIKSNLNSRK